MYFGFWDVTYILVIIGAILSMMASAHVQAVYSRYARVRSRSGLTGAQAAQMILQRNDVSDVAIGHVSGNLTDHYDPSKQQVNLSDTTYGSESVAAVAVAAHECGHVMQNHTGYVPLQIRSAMESLPEPYGLVMDLVLIEGLDYREISRLTGTKEATLRSLYARGRKKLIAALNIKTN